MNLKTDILFYDKDQIQTGLSTNDDIFPTEPTMTKNISIQNIFVNINIGVVVV